MKAMPQPLRRPGAPRRTPLAALAAPVAAVGLLASACANFEPAPVMTVNGTEITQSSLDTELDLIEDSKEYRELLEGQLGAPSAGTGRSRSTVSTEFVANLLSERVYFTLVEDQLDRPVDEDDLRAATDRLAAENNEQFAALDDEPRRRLARRVALLTVLQEEVLPGYFEERKDDFDTLCVSTSWSAPRVAPRPRPAPGSTRSPPSSRRAPASTRWPASSPTTPPPPRARGTWAAGVRSASSPPSGGPPAPSRWVR